MTTPATLLSGFSLDPVVVGAVDLILANPRNLDQEIARDTDGRDLAIGQIHMGDDDHVGVLVAAIGPLVDAQHHQRDRRLAAPDLGFARISRANRCADQILDDADSGWVVPGRQRGNGCRRPGLVCESPALTLTVVAVGSAAALSGRGSRGLNWRSTRRADLDRISLFRGGSG